MNNIKIIFFAAFLLVTPARASGQVTSFTGNVTSSESGNALVDASVSLNNSGVYTNTDGNFKLIISRPGLIKISHIGFVTISIASDTLVSNKQYRILLRPSITRLNEVIIKARSLSAKEIVNKAIGNLPGLLNQDEFVLEALYRQMHYSEVPSINSKKYSYFFEAGVLLHHMKSESKYKPIIKEIRRSNDLRFSSYNKITSANIAREERNTELSNGFLDIDYTRDRKPLKTDNSFWNPNPILCRLDKRFTKTHEFRLDSIATMDGKDVFIIKILPSNSSIEVETHLGVSPYIPDGLLYITDEDFFILEFHYAYVKKQSERNNGLSEKILEYVRQGDYFFKDIVKYRIYDNRLYLSYLMRDTKDDIYSGGLSQSGLLKSKAIDEDDFRYYKLKRELIVSRIDIDISKLSEAEMTPKYSTLFPKAYEYNKAFWMRLNTTLIDKLEKKVLDDLGEGIPLEMQFELNQNN